VTVILWWFCGCAGGNSGGEFHVDGADDHAAGAPRLRFPVHRLV